MATRQMLRQRRGTPAAAAAAATATVAAMSFLTLPRTTTLLAEAPASPAAASAPSRKSIYDDDDEPPASSAPSSSTPAPSASTPSASKPPSPTDRLAAQIGRGRTFLHAGTARAEDAVNAGLARTLRLEHRFTETVAGLAPAPETGERLAPGLVYVLVAGMAGSIVSRRRALPIRALAPPAVALAAAWALLPCTMRNVSELVRETERKRAPALADAHARLGQAAATAWREAKSGAVGASRGTEQVVRKAREAVEGWVSKGR